MQIAFRRSNAAGQGRGPFAETEAGVGLGSSADGHDLSNRPRVDAVAGTEHRCGSERCCRREGAAAAVQSPGCGVSKASQRRRAKTRAAGWCCTEDEVREHARPRAPTTGVILGTGAMGCVSRPRVPRTASWAPEEPKDGQGGHPEADTRRYLLVLVGREHRTCRWGDAYRTSRAVMDGTRGELLRRHAPSTPGGQRRMGSQDVMRLPTVPR